MGRKDHKLLRPLDSASQPVRRHAPLAQYYAPRNNVKRTGRFRLSIIHILNVYPKHRRDGACAHSKPEDPTVPTIVCR